MSVYLFILILLRLSGKREIGQLSAIELVSIILISNAVQNSMNGGDNSLVGGFVLSTVLILMSALVGVLSYRFRKVRKLVEGVPTILIYHGKVIEKNLKRELITHEDLVSMLRKQGTAEIHHVKLAVLESSGTLSITPFA